MQKGRVVAGGLVVARGHAAVVLHPANEPLNLVSILVQLTINLTRMVCIFSARNDGLRLELGFDMLGQVAAVVAFVCEDGFDGRFLLLAATEGQKRLGLRTIAGLAGREHERQRIAQGVYERVDLCGEAVATSSEDLGFGVAFFGQRHAGGPGPSSSRA